MMRRIHRSVRLELVVGLILSALVALDGKAAEIKPEAGLVVTIVAGGEKEKSMAQNVALHVEDRKSVV